MRACRGPTLWLLGRLAGRELPRADGGLEEDARLDVLLEHVADDLRFAVESALVADVRADLVDAHALLGTRVDGSGDDGIVDGVAVGGHRCECECVCLR